MPRQSFTDLPLRFLFALISFTFRGWIGWSGIVLVLLKVIGVIHWPWWVATLPLEYGVIYCLYMTIDGALYRAGLKDVGRYARFTRGEQEHAKVVAQQAQAALRKQQQRQGSAERAIDDPNRRDFAEALLRAALYADLIAGQAQNEGDIASLMNEIGRIKKTAAEKGRMMDALKPARLEICNRVYDNLPERLRNSDKVARAIAEQVNYATASAQFVGDDDEMRRKLEALVTEWRLNGAEQAASELISAVKMRPHYLALAERIMR